MGQDSMRATQTSEVEQLEARLRQWARSSAADEIQGDSTPSRSSTSGRKLRRQYVLKVDNDSPRVVAVVQMDQLQCMMWEEKQL